ncbi:MAG: ABC transporter substrate-binding protein [Nitrososphaerota archaeon]|nr:ABC transporter substrate-binding protein [Nitrososphaerota archaeon]MDG7023925.1 ABC transporter substrate-binding protein [Nitrososphaerota archaeon]
MPNFGIEKLTDSDFALTDAVGRRIRLGTGSKHGSSKTFELYLRAPVSNVVACSPIQLAYSLRLEKEFGGVLDRFVGILNAAEAHLVLPELVERFRTGKLRDVRSIAELRAMNPGLVFSFIYPREDPQLVSIMERFGLPHVVLDSWYEPSYSDRIRWIEFIAQFFGLGDKAHSLVLRIMEELDAIREGAKGGEHPKVMWFVDFQDYAFVTGGRSWVAESIRELGGEVLTSGPGARGSADASREWVAENMPRADVLVFTMVRPSVSHIQQMYPKVVETPAFKSRRIYGFSLSYWQESAYAPESWYAELAGILHPAPSPIEPRIFTSARV